MAKPRPHASAAGACSDLGHAPRREDPRGLSTRPVSSVVSPLAITARENSHGLSGKIPALPPATWVAEQAACVPHLCRGDGASRTVHRNDKASRVCEHTVSPTRSGPVMG